MGFLLIQELFAGQLLPVLLMLQGKKIIASGAAIYTLACALCSFPEKQKWG